jgi:hypothetical protein
MMTRTQMRKVTREEIIDYKTYNDRRPEIRKDALEAKERRRVHVGPNLTFLFENATTTRYQIQEMMRIEELVREREILHELETYNEVIGDDGEIGFTLLIEIETPEERAVKLAEWIELPAHIYAELEDGSKVYATYDERQVGDDLLSSVQYMKFDTEGEVPVTIGSDLPQYEHATELSDDVRAALAEDFADE